MQGKEFIKVLGAAAIIYAQGVYSEKKAVIAEKLRALPDAVEDEVIEAVEHSVPLLLKGAAELLASW